MSATPTLSLTGVSSNIIMISNSSDSVWTYAWAVSGTTVSSTTATVSATDLVGNAYSGSDNLVFTIDNQAPLILSTSIVGNNENILISYSEPVQLSNPSYEPLNFKVTQNGNGTATASYTGYTLGTTQSNTVILNIDVVNRPSGDELLTVGPKTSLILTDIAGNYAYQYNDTTNQASNTVYLKNASPIFEATTISQDNTQITIVFNEGVSATANVSTITATDFTLSVSGGTAVLGSSTPLSLTKTNSRTYILTTAYNIQPDGTEQIKVTPIDTAIFDEKGKQIDLSETQSNTVNLNDTQGPNITAITLDDQNRFIDLTFSEGIYATIPSTNSIISVNSSSPSMITTSSFQLVQTAGTSYSLTMSSVLTAQSTSLSGGETALRINLFGGGIKPTGNEVFEISATSSRSIFDAQGNPMMLSQSINEFTLRPPTSGGVSIEKSTITVAPSAIIANGVNYATVTVQAKDSVGQSFFEGGYRITILGPQGALDTKDNQDGTYSAIYTPALLFEKTVDIEFEFSVINEPGIDKASLTLYSDGDSDGVNDIIDECPGTQEGLTVAE